jgi:hypothetical protein
MKMASIAGISVAGTCDPNEILLVGWQVWQDHTARGASPIGCRPRQSAGVADRDAAMD